jgi:hypothetical protein
MGDERRHTTEVVARTIAADPAASAWFGRELHGQFRGVPVHAMVNRFSRGPRQRGGLYVLWSVPGPTWGVTFGCSPPAVFDKGKNFTGNPAFDARYSVNGARSAVMRHVLTPDVQSRMLALNTQLQVRDWGVECLAPGPHDESRGVGVLELAFLVLQSLPEASQAWGPPSVRPVNQGLDPEQKRALGIWVALVVGAVTLGVVIVAFAIVILVVLAL